MLVAAAVCPCPPLLVPEVAAGAAPELDTARAACADAVGVLAAARPDLLVVVGTAEAGDRGPHPAGARGSFRGFGADIVVRLGTDAPQGVRDRAAGRHRPGAAEPHGAPGASGSPGRGEGAHEPPETAPGAAAPVRALPHSLAVGAWLLDRARWAASPLEGLGVDETLAPERALAAGREIGARAERVALLVMGDGSACRTVKAPGYLDTRAADFDAFAARALGDADLAALAALDATLAHELKAAGRAPWQVLTGAAEGAGLAGRLLYDEAPYGVGYFVTAWS
ncbi:hypothetical protein [Streptomyces sp. NPDC020965]|uniref:hypothetical protein n=1 Tax=Streptomyces sp. NPDC020965 TaxID=3365105 RepID=UPI0037B5C5A1